VAQALHRGGNHMNHPTRLETVLQVGTVIGVPQSSCVLMLATVYLYLGKKGKHLGPVGVREDRVKGRSFGIKNFVGGQAKSFCRKFGNGGVGPPLLPSFPALPPSRYPPGGFT